MAVAVAVGGEVANYCDVDTLANLACTQTSIYCTGQSRCTQHYIALHFIALHCLASLCVPQRWTALLAWPPYQRLQNGPHTHSTLSHHYTPLQSSLHFIHHFNQFCTSTSNSIRAHGYWLSAMLHTVVGFSVQKSPMRIVYRMCTYGVR